MLMLPPSSFPNPSRAPTPTVYVPSAQWNDAGQNPMHYSTGAAPGYTSMHFNYHAKKAEVARNSTYAQAAADEIQLMLLVLHEIPGKTTTSLVNVNIQRISCCIIYLFDL